MADAQKAYPGRLVAHGALWLVTLCSAAASQTPLGPNEHIWDLAALVLHDPRRLAPGGLFAVWLMAILTAHEAGHMLMARYHGVACGWPYFIPAPTTFGTLGAVLALHGPAPNRRALLHIAVSGPVAGTCLALPILVLGLGQTLGESPGNCTPYARLGHSLMTAWLGAAHPGPLLLGCMAPAAVAGWVGLLVQAFNLLPIGFLDGGQIVYALCPSKHRAISYTVAGALTLFGMAQAFATPMAGGTIWLVVSATAMVYGVAHDGVRDGFLPLSRYDLLWAMLAMGLCILTWVPVPITQG